MQQEEPATAQTRADWFNHGQRGRHGHRSIERIAALAEDFHTGLGCQRMAAGNRSAIRVCGARRRGVGCPRGWRQHQCEQQQGTGNEFHAVGFSDW
ncbi:hypothetical protein D3C71_2008480 [compost metagenome]